MIDWDSIVREHRPAVWRTAYRLLGNRADADECFQETFAVAVTVVRSSRSPIRNWGALLVRLATTKAVDRLRQRVRRSSREVPGGGGLTIDVVPDRQLTSRPEDRMQQAEMSARLRTALAHLPSKQADAFCLHCFEDWSYAEIAEHLDTSVNDVGVSIHRARIALRQQIGFILSIEASVTKTTTTAITTGATEVSR